VEKGGVQFAPDKEAPVFIPGKWFRKRGTVISVRVNFSPDAFRKGLHIISRIGEFENTQSDIVFYC